MPPWRTPPWVVVCRPDANCKQEVELMAADVYRAAEKAERQANGGAWPAASLRLVAMAWIESQVRVRP